MNAIPFLHTKHHRRNRRISSRTPWQRLKRQLYWAWDVVCNVAFLCVLLAAVWGALCYLQAVVSLFI